MLASAHLPNLSAETPNLSAETPKPSAKINSMLYEYKAPILNYLSYLSVLRDRMYCHLRSAQTFRWEGPNLPLRHAQTFRRNALIVSIS